MCVVFIVFSIILGLGLRREVFRVVDRKLLIFISVGPIVSHLKVYQSNKIEDLRLRICRLQVKGGVHTMVRIEFEYEDIVRHSFSIFGTKEFEDAERLVRALKLALALN